MLGLFSFKGRARRREFWAVMVLSTVALLVGVVAISSTAFQLVLDRPDRTGVAVQMVLAMPLFGLMILWMQMAASVRRLHDMGRSGWVLAKWMAVFLGIGVVFAVAASLLPNAGGIGAFLLSVGYMLWMGAQLGLRKGEAQRNAHGEPPGSLYAELARL